MKRSGCMQKAILIVFTIVPCIIVLLLYACGGGSSGGSGGSGGSGSGGTGSITFTLAIQDNSGAGGGQIAAKHPTSDHSSVASVQQSSVRVFNAPPMLRRSGLLKAMLPSNLLSHVWFLAPTTAYAGAPPQIGGATASNTLMLAQVPVNGIDCEENQIGEIEAFVYDEKGREIADGGPWPCEQHEGTIENVPAGDFRKIVILARDKNSGEYAYRGEKGGPDDPITILPGRTTAVGKIILDPLEPPNAPQDFAASDGNFTDSIRLSWQDVENEDGYYIYRLENDEWKQIGDTSIDITAYNDGQPCDSGQIWYKVTAYNDAGESPDSVQDSGYTNECPIDVPRAPFNLLAGDGEFADQIRLTWDWEGGEPLDEFRIYRSLNPAGPWGDPIGMTAAGNREYVDSGPECGGGTTYYYMVRAYNSAGESEDSDSDGGYTDDCPIDPPVAPFNLTASDGEYPNQVILEWEWNGSEPPDGFRIYRSVESVPNWDDYFYREIAGSENRNYMDLDVACGGEWWNYMVRAYNSVGESDDSDPDSGFTADCSIFDFETDNQKWRLVGLYDDGGLNPIPGLCNTSPCFNNASAPWFESGGGESSRIGSGPGERLTMPSSPTDDLSLHWDLNSVDLSSNVSWQGLAALRYDVKGGTLTSTSAIGSENVYVQTVLHVRRPDGAESYFTDGVFHNIPLGKPEEMDWQTHTLDITALDMPEGTILLDINFRIFFRAGAIYDGYIWIDNVTGLF